MTVTRILSLAAAVAIAVGGYVHFDLYRHGYQSIRNIGVLFALNIVLSAAFTAALTMRTDVYTAVAALLFSAGSFGGFVISRSIGLLGFKETGLNPTPPAYLQTHFAPHRLTRYTSTR